MTPPSTPLADSVRAFRDATALESDGKATRARVLASVVQGNHARARGRKLLIAGAPVLVALISGSAAWTAIGHWTTAPVPPMALTPARTRILRASPGAAVAETTSPAVATPPPSRTIAENPTAETDSYAAAHHAHFADTDPAAALAAWNRYLRAYPRGAFVLEARYNRAVCLIRLRRWDEAMAALAPFADGAPDQYRQAEAQRLRAWIGAQPR